MQWKVYVSLDKLKCLYCCFLFGLTNILRPGPIVTDSPLPGRLSVPYVFVEEIKLSRTFPFIPAGDYGSQKPFLTLNNKLSYMAATRSFTTEILKSNISINLYSTKFVDAKVCFTGYHCSALHWTSPHWFAFGYITIYWTALHFTALRCTALHLRHCTAQYSTVLSV